MDLATARHRLREANRNAWPVGADERLYGIVTARQIEGIKDPSLKFLRHIVALDGKYPYVHSDHPLSLALERMGAAGVDTIPVVSRADIRRIYGVVTLPNVLAAYGVTEETAAAGSKHPA